MLATVTEKPFDDAEWIFEIKWDGYRAIAEIDDPIRMYSRKGLNFEGKYPTVWEGLQAQQHRMVLDGELVVFNDQGLPDFQLLQQFKIRPHLPVYYQVFDLLSLNGTSTESLSVLQRKELLKEALVENEYISYCDHVVKDGVEFFELIRQRQMEGIIAKNVHSTYIEGRRSTDWLKIKFTQMEDVIICGFTAPSGSRSYFGSLILGRYEDEKLVYCGHTGTGFTENTLADMYEVLSNLVTDKIPFERKPAINAAPTWVLPELICTIKFTEITRDGIFRHPVFVGLRPELVIDDIKNKKTLKNSKQTKSENKMPKKTIDKDKIRKIDGNEVILTNQTKIYWPGEGYTKGDLINYYDKMAKYILPYLKNRPESLNRFPSGITGESFYQKDAGDHAPEWVQTKTLYSESADKDIDYIICNNKSTLLYLANLGCIELNPWNSTLEHLDNPDFLIMDLDPSENNSFEDVIETALTVHEILESAGARHYVKTSGSTGLHIYIPLGAKYDYKQARDFAHLIAVKTVELLPDITTIERSLQKRDKGKLYVDYLQNKKGQTIASPYSVRPKPGATASAPLEWKEVKHGLEPAQFDIHTLPARVEKIGDLFKPVLGRGINLEKILNNLA